MPTSSATCLCGALWIETQGAPWRTLICSCTDCRKKSGSAFGHSTYWPQDAVTVHGAYKSWTRLGQDGRSLMYNFCPTCGTALFWKADFAPDHIGIGGGNFDNADSLAPASAYWVDGRPDWVLHVADLPSKAKQ